MFCPKCGKERADDAEFCMHCGARIVTRAGQIKAPEKPLQEKSGNGKKWGIIGGAVAGLIAVAVLLIIVLGGKDKPAGGQDGLAGETAAGADGVQTDDSGKAMVNLSLCFREVLYNEGLPDTRVILTGGYDNPNGEIIADFTTQSDGTVMTELEAGEYTLCWEAEGYYSGQENLTVSDTEINVVRHMIPVLTEQKAYVLIEWDSDRDLDLCVFNAQTKQYINIMSAVDDAGDFLFYDNDGADGYELICLNDYTAGIYTVYVRDGASLLQGTESIMEAEGLTVSVYTADGLLYRAKADTEETAALWSAVYLHHGEAIELEEYIYDLTDYAWAVRDKHDESNARNEEVWNAEEDAALIANLQNKDSSLRGLMEALVTVMSEDKINGLLQGDRQGVEVFFGIGPVVDEQPAASSLPYVHENEPDNYEELLNQKWAAYFLKEEQARYLLYSVCGKQINFNFSIYDGWVDPYIGFGGFAGRAYRNNLEQFSVERINANTWKVRANDVYCPEWDPSRVISRVCFTVVKNPDSCFDGYSLTGFEVEEKAPTDWAQIYYDYLTKAPDWAMEYYDNNDMTGIVAELIYIDDDMVPELYIDGPRVLGFAPNVLYISNGEVQKLGGSAWSSSINIKPYTGFFMDTVGMHIQTHSAYYCLKDGMLTELGRRDWGSPEDVDVHYLGEQEVPKEKFVDTIKAYIGSEDWEFEDSEWLVGEVSYGDCLDYLYWQSVQCDEDD